jgi:diadenosine tetraphosphatase ApaH/serine/threonine PP2A family protein phosphatase
MRYALLADIHSNSAALAAVLQDIERQGTVDDLLFLGDIVGYGPDCNECVSLVKESGAISVSGNHDLASIEKLELSYFSPDAARAARWTTGQLQAGNRVYLDRLPSSVVHGDFTLVHGSPRQPVWEYLISVGSAEQNFAHFSTPYCFVGHSHLPLVFKQAGNDVSSVKFSENIGLALEGGRYIVNPGSVGQPRDGDPHASYALFDTESRILRLRRVQYDIAAVQKRFMDAGLPVRLASRLWKGM